MQDKPFPPSPWKPLANNLTTVITIQAIALIAAIAVLGLREAACW